MTREPPSGPTPLELTAKKLHQLQDSPTAARHIIRTSTSWKHGLLTADLAPLEAKAAAGDLDAQARIKMLNSITARQK